MKTLFTKAADSVARFLDRQEIHAVESCKKAAEDGYGYIAARGGAVKIRITAEKAKATIESCEQRLDILYKRNPDAAPKPGAEMSLKSSFQKAVGAVGRFIDREEIRQLESRKGMAQAGYFMIAGGRASIMRISPEESKKTVIFCDKRIAEIQEKHGWSPKP